MKKLVTLAAAFALVASTAQAQTVATTANPGSVTTYATVTVPTILNLSINDTSTSIASPVQADFDNGFQDAASTVIATVKSNKAWSLTIKGGAANWTGTGGASATKVVADLHWSITGPGAGTAMTTSAVSIASSATGTAGSNTTVNYRIIWSYATDTPGTYTIPVIFTAAAP